MLAGRLYFYQRFHIMKMHEIECKTIKLIKNFCHTLNQQQQQQKIHNTIHNFEKMRTTRTSHSGQCVFGFDHVTSYTIRLLYERRFHSHDVLGSVTVHCADKFMQARCHKIEIP